MWKCVKCGEQIEEGFEGCWNCGTTRDGVEDPYFRKADEAETDASEEQSADAAPTREERPTRRHIGWAVLLLALVCGGVVALWIRQAGRCEVILKKNGVPLAGATVEVAFTEWDGIYTLDSEGRWDMGWHLFNRPGHLIVTITDSKNERVHRGGFTFPEESGWTVDFCGRTVTRTRRVSWGPFFRRTESISWTDLTPRDRKPTED